MQQCAVQKSFVSHSSVALGCAHAIVKSVFKHSCHVVNERWLHPCRIQGQQVWVHCPRLPEDNRSYFDQLVAFAKARGIRLMADRRGNAGQVPGVYASGGSRRKGALLPVVALCFGLSLPEASAQPVDLLTHEHAVTLSLASVQPAEVMSRKMPPNMEVVEHYERPAEAQGARFVNVDPYWQKRIAKLLIARLIPSAGDPSDMPSILKEMAAYYSRYEQVQDLFKTLEAHEWQLRYAPGAFQTQVKKSRFRVREVVVQFDPLSGAQLKFNRGCQQKVDFCYASPADVLLHELLHVKAVWQDGQALAVSGMLGSGVYPYQHEYQTIEAEKQLYRTMRKVDSKPRPLRTDHTGKTVRVACVTCVQ